jgi:hypothetical protein
VEGLSPAELLDGVFGDRGEEVHQVAIGISEQQGAVAPRQRGGLLNPVVDDGLEPLVLAVDVVNLEFDDDGVIIGWASGIFAEQLAGLRMADARVNDGKATSAKTGV